MLDQLQPKVAIVILNYNTRALLERFLPSVIETNYGNKEIWVVDNASNDDSVQFVYENFEDVKLLKTDENLGYAGGYNWALKQIDAAYYVLLNSDVRVTPNWINPLIDLALRDKETAAIQPKILDAKNTSMFEYAGAAGGFLDKWGYAFCRGRIFESLEEDLGQYDDEREVFWATGACLFVNSKMFHEVGGLDDEFFAHMEEIDLCWRLKLRGKKIYVNPQSVVYHVGGGTLSEGSKMKYYLNFRNNLVLISKNDQSVFWFLKLFWRMILDGVSGVKFVLDGNPTLFFEVIKAHVAFWKSFRKTLKKRNLIQGASTHQVKLYPQSIVWQHFAKKVKKFSDL
jgi:GT2 family glycosyltransferase